MLEESIFDFRYVRLYDVDKEKWLNFLQTVETLIRVNVFISFYKTVNLDIYFDQRNWRI